MKTIQGKDFNYEDILLYNVVKDQIIMIVDDEEQMKMFNYTGKTADAPISRIPFTKEAEYEIITHMKKIKNYDKKDNCIEVTYVDKKKSKFDLSNEEVIKNILESQNRVKMDVISSNWTNLSEEEKETKRKTISSKWKKGIAGTLAAISLVTFGAFHKDDIAAALTKDKENDPSNDIQHEAVIEMPTNNREQRYYEEVMAYDFTELGRQLYQETYAKDNLVLRYQQVVNINWDEDLATKVVEFMNGKYPQDMLSLSNPDAFARATEIQQAWSLLITGNLNPETNVENMVDLDNYFIRDMDRVFVHNAMTVARNAMNETLGNPLNGYIIEEDDYSTMNKFTREFLSAVDQCLNYEYDTKNDPAFKELCSGARWTISSIFQQTNNVIPQWSYITREENGVEQRIYYRSFKDDATGDFYYAIPGDNGTVDYRCDTNGITYNEYEMFAISGTPMIEEQRNMNVNINPNLHQVGIQTDIDNEFNKATEDVYNLRGYAFDLNKGVSK